MTQLAACTFAADVNEVLTDTDRIYLERSRLHVGLQPRFGLAVDIDRVSLGTGLSADDLETVVAVHDLEFKKYEVLIADALHHFELDQTVGQELHRPLGAACRWCAAGQSDEIRLLMSVEETSFAGPGSIAQSGIWPFFN